MAHTAHTALGRIGAGVACVVGGANVVLSVVAFFLDPSVLEALYVGALPVSTKIFGVLGLQCAVASAVGLLFGRMSRWAPTARSLAAAGLPVAALSLVAPWTAVFNIQVLLAPSFTFAAGPIVMSNPYIAVVSTYAACAFLSLGFIVWGVACAHEDEETHRSEQADTLSSDPFLVFALGIQSLLFVILGMMGAI